LKKNDIEVWLNKNIDDIGKKAAYEIKEMELRDANNKIVTCSSNIIRYRKDIFKMNRDYIIFSMNNMLEYIRLTYPVYICIRKELEMPIDEEFYNQTMATTMDETKRE
jgi:hypothetical protein